MKQVCIIACMLLFWAAAPAFANKSNGVKSGSFGGDGYNAPQLILHADYTFEYRSFLLPVIRLPLPEPGLLKKTNWYCRAKVLKNSCGNTVS